MGVYSGNAYDAYDVRWLHRLISNVSSMNQLKGSDTDGGTAQIGDSELKPEPGAKLKIWDSDGPEGDWLKVVTQQSAAEYGIEVILSRRAYRCAVKTEDRRPGEAWCRCFLRAP